MCHLRIRYKDKSVNLFISEILIFLLSFDQKTIWLSCYIQMFLHSQCIIYIFLMLTMTGMGLRSAFVLLFALIFYTLTTFIILFTGLQHRGNLILVPTNFIQIYLFQITHYCCRFDLDNCAFCRSNNSILILRILCNLCFG